MKRDPYVYMKRDPFECALRICERFARALRASLARTHICMGLHSQIRSRTQRFTRTHAYMHVLALRDSLALTRTHTCMCSHSETRESLAHVYTYTRNTLHHTHELHRHNSIYTHTRSHAETRESLAHVYTYTQGFARARTHACALACYLARSLNCTHCCSLSLSLLCSF